MSLMIRQTNNPPKGETDIKPISVQPLYGGRREQDAYI